MEHDWLTHIDAQLEQCDYFLLLLSPQAAVSEMVIEELRRVKQLQELRYDDKPAVAFTKLVQANEPVELESVLAFKLHSMGLVQLHGNQVTPRFQLYQQYFRDRLFVGADGSRRAATSE
ncbi:MAG TPA: AAA-like domain-containing protein [Chroococcales cyanobacterium]